MYKKIKLLLFIIIILFAKVFTSDTLIVKGDYNFPPYEFLDSLKTPTGFNIDILRAIANQMNLNLSISLEPWHKVRQELEKGKIDIISGMFYSKERHKKVDFSIPHTVVSHALFVKNNSDIKKLSDIKNKKIAVQQQDIMHDFVKNSFKNSDITALETPKKCLEELEKDKYDCVLIGYYQGLFYIDKYNFKNIRVAEKGFKTSKYCFAIKKNSTELLYKLNEGLTIIKSEGIYNKIYDKWFNYESDKDSFYLFIKNVLFIIIPALVIFFVVIIWNRSLSINIRKKTADLKKELLERKNLQKKYEEKEKHLRLITDNLPAQIAQVDENERYLFVNKAYRKFFNVEEENFIIGKKIKDLLGPENYCRVQNNIKKAYKGKHVEFENALKFGDRDEKYRYTVYVPYTNEKGEVISIIALSIDITDKIYAEKRKEKLEQRLKQSEKMEVIGQLAGGIAHDFNNQLGGILGYADMLREEVQNNEKLFFFAENIILGVKRASDLTDKLLAFARKGKYRSVAVDIRDIVDEVSIILERSINKKIDVKKIYEAKNTCVKGDPTQLQSVFLNIAINARDAMPWGGEIIFHLNNIDLKNDDIKELGYKLREGKYLRISVTDDGEGMDEATMKRAFEPFFTTKEIGKGTGLGLSAVYGTIKNHKGAVNIYSQKGVGTTVKIYLPLYKDSNKGHKNNEINKDEVKKPFINGSGTVLLVDDEDMFSKMAYTMLKDFGYDVITAIDGMDALSKYEKLSDKIDLVMLDVLMPRMSGPELFYKIKKINPGVKVLLCSGYSINGEAEKLLIEGVSGFIQKPFDRATLSDKIELIMKN